MYFTISSKKDDNIKDIDDEIEYLVSVNNVEAGFGTLQYALSSIDMNFDLPEADVPEVMEEDKPVDEEPDYGKESWLAEGNRQDDNVSLLC